MPRDRRFGRSSIGLSEFPGLTEYFQEQQRLIIDILAPAGCLRQNQFCNHGQGIFAIIPQDLLDAFSPELAAMAIHHFQYSVRYNQQQIIGLSLYFLAGKIS